MSVELTLLDQDSDSTELDLTSGEASSASLSVQHSETQLLVYVLAGLAVALLLTALVFAVLALRNRG